MRVRVDQPDLVESLLEFLGQRVNCVAARISADEVDVSLLESLRFDAHRAELNRLLREWEGAHPAGHATIVPEFYAVLGASAARERAQKP